MQPSIIMESPETMAGRHNTEPLDRLMQGNTYKDLSTICIVPTRGMIPARVVQSWMGLMSAMNQKFTRIFVSGMEVGEAYSSAIEQILANPELSQWRYILTLEEDNIPPPDGLLRLYESMEDYAAVGGLYWTKGEHGQPMIYGEPTAMVDFVPQLPQADTVQECNGLGMGFTLFRLDIFKDERLPKPWFQTLQQYTPGVGAQSYTQDLFFFEQLRKLGYRVACDTRVRVGHLDPQTDVVW